MCPRFRLPRRRCLRFQDTNPGSYFQFRHPERSRAAESRPVPDAGHELRVGSTWADVTPTLSAYWDIDGATAGAGGAGRRAVRGTTRRRTGAPVRRRCNHSNMAWRLAVQAVSTAGDSGTGGATVYVYGHRRWYQNGPERLTFEDGTPNAHRGGCEFNGRNDNRQFWNVTAACIGAPPVRPESIRPVRHAVFLSGECFKLTGAHGTLAARTLQVGNAGATGTLPTTSAITPTVERSPSIEPTPSRRVPIQGAAITGTGGLTEAGKRHHDAQRGQHLQRHDAGYGWRDCFDEQTCACNRTARWI